MLHSQPTTLCALLLLPLSAQGLLLCLVRPGTQVKLRIRPKLRRQPLERPRLPRRFSA